MIFQVQNSGVKKIFIFEDEKDCKRFIETLKYYNVRTPSSRFAFRKRGKKERQIDDSPLVEIEALCLLPNHFHLMLGVKAKTDVANFMSKVANSYTKYFNARHKRRGSLFKGRYRSKEVPKTLAPRLARYIHLEPLIMGVVRSIDKFPYSTYYETLKDRPLSLVGKTAYNGFQYLGQFKQFTSDRLASQEESEILRGYIFDK